MFYITYDMFKIIISHIEYDLWYIYIYILYDMLYVFIVYLTCE